MSETNYFIENSANGDAVARAIGSLYVNSYTCPTEQFYECMMQTDKNVKHNFTMLCLEWFKSLAETKTYDARNEASVQTAQRIADEIQYEFLGRQKMAKNGTLPECNFNYRSDGDAVRLLEKYLRLSEDNRAFIYTMLYHVHKTSQQRFSQMCLIWLKKASELTARRTRYVILARKAARHYTRFPFI